MSCDRCAESAREGALVCGFCGEPLGTSQEPEAHPIAPPASAPSPGKRVAVFIGGFFLALLTMGLGATIGTPAGAPGAIAGAILGPIALILIARANGARTLAIGAITGVAVVVLVFGGCLMMLTAAMSP